MIRHLRPLLLSVLCAALLAPAPARAWSELPAEAQTIIDQGGMAAGCAAECPPGMQKKTVNGGVPAFDDCTDAYQFYIANGYELIMTLMLQYAQVYNTDYLAACTAHGERVPKSSLPAAQKTAAAAQGEMDAIPAVMRTLITGRIAALVPAHCRTNKPAQDEAAAAFDEWTTATAAHYKKDITEYMTGETIECGQFIDTRAANIYETDFTGMPLLGLIATLGYTRYPKEEELKKAILDYKTAYDGRASAPQP